MFLMGTETAMVDGTDAAEFLRPGGCRFALVEARHERAFLRRADALGLRYAPPQRFEGYNYSTGPSGFDRGLSLGERAVSAADGFRAGSASVRWLRQIEANGRGALAMLLRPPRGGAVAWVSQPRLLIAAMLALAVVIACMALLDAWSVSRARQLPADLIAAARSFTDLGKSGWFLWPLGVVLVALAILDSPAVNAHCRVGCWPRSLSGWSLCFSPLRCRDYL